MKPDARNLSVNMRGEDVKLLQKTLSKLGFSIEDKDGFFGKTTRRAVLDIQKKHGIKATGIVDKETAEVINSGAPEQQRFTVHGRVLRSDGAALAGVTVSAVDWDRAGENPLGTAKTQDDGRYEISFTADKYRRSSGEVGGPDLIVRVYNAQGLPIATSPRKNNAGVDETIDLTAPVIDEVQQAKMHRLGKISGLKGSRIASLLAKGHTISTLTDKALQDMVKAKDLKDQEARELGLTVNLYNLFDGNLELTETLKKGGFLRPGGRQLKNLRDLAAFDTADWLTILCKASIKLPGEMTVENYAESLSHKMAALYPTDAFFGRLPPFNAADLTNGIKRVAPLFDGDHRVFSIPGLARITNIAESPETEGLHSIFKRFLKLDNHEPSLKNRQSLQKDILLASIFRKGSFDALPGLIKGNSPVIGTSIFDRLDTGQMEQSEIEAIHTTYTQLKRLVNLYPGLGLGDVLDDPKLPHADKVARITERIGLLNSVWQQNPDVEVLKLDYSPNSPDMAALNLKDLSATEQAMVLSTLKAYQRAYVLTGDVGHARTILEAGYISATGIVNGGFETFVQSTGLRAEVARTHFDTARNMTVTVGAGLGTLLDYMWGGFNWLNVSNIKKSSPKADEIEAFNRLDDFEALFGNQTYCQCQHCQSILSPTAYFVDLMHFLETNLPTAIVQLRSRRPDLWSVELTCDNTNTKIPTLEVVNEILESYIFNIFTPEISVVFVLNDASFQALRDSGVPEAVLLPLQNLVNKKFVKLEDFAEEIKKQLQQQDLVKYGGLITNVSLHFEIFVLTDDSFQKLQMQGIPDTIIKKLQPLKGQKFYLKSLFIGMVKRQLGAKYATYQDRILEVASSLNPGVLISNFSKESFVFQVINELSRFICSFQRPFVLPIEKLQSYLALFDLTRAIVAREIGADPEVLARTTLNLSIEEYALITQLNIYPYFLLLLYGKLSFEPGSKDKISPFDVQDILRPMGISRSDLGELIKTRFVSGGIQIIAQKRKGSVQNDIEIIYNLTLELLDRMHRFTRLWRRLPPMADAPDGPRWTMAELDLVLFLMGCTGSSPRNIDFENLVTILSLQERWGMSVARVCGMWCDDLNDIKFAGQKASTSLLDQLFNLPAFNQVNTPFPRDTSLFVHPAFIQPGDSSSTDDTLHRLHAGLEVNDEELYQLIVNLDTALGMKLSDMSPVAGFYLTAHNITLLYRHARLAKLLNLSIPELFQLIEFTIPGGVIDNSYTQVKNLANTAKLLEFYDWWQTSGYKLDDLGFITRGTVYKPEDYPDANELVKQMVEKIQADKALEFADTVFAFLEGVTEEQSRKIITANSSDPKANNIEAVNPEKTIYRLASTFTSSTTLTIPSEVTSAVAHARNMTDLNTVEKKLQTETRLALLKYHASEVIPARLAAMLNLSVEKLTSLLPFKEYLFTQVITLILRGDTTFTDPSQNPLVRLVDTGLRLSTLFSNQVFDPETLNFINNQKIIFSIRDLTEVPAATVPWLSVYTTLADRAAGEGSSSVNRSAFSSTKVSQLLSFLNARLMHEPVDQAKLAQALADVLQVEIGLATALLNNVPLPGNPPEVLLRLARCATLVTRLGVGGETLPLIISDDGDKLNIACDALVGALRAKHPDEKDWQVQVNPIDDKLRSRKRDTLCDFLMQLSRLGGFGQNEMKTMHDLYQYFLIDVELEGCARTSRIVAAISSVQLYIQRILMNMESVNLTPEMAKEWEWRKNYRVWEANRKVFLYPENYIEPDLRDDKTPLFQDLESKLLQQEINQQNVLDAYSSYMSGFEEVARLKIAGSYHDIKSYLEMEDTLHLVGVTQDNPPTYYYRAVNNAYWGEKQPTMRGIDWSHWRKVSVHIPVRKVSPMVYNGRLYVFWVEFTTTPKNQVSDGKSRFVGYKHKLTLKYTNLRLDGTWTAPQVISLKIPSVFQTGEGIIEDRLVNPDEMTKFNQLMLELNQAIVQSNIAKIIETQDLLTDFLLKDMSCPQFDTIPHMEPKDGYTLSGFKWDQIYPSVMDQDLIVTGRNFLLRSAIDFYQKAVIPTSRPKLTPSIDISILNSYLPQDGSMRRLRYISPRWPFDDYASCSLLLYHENIYKLDDETWGQVDLNQYFAHPVQVRHYIADLSPSAELAVINGSNVGVSPYRFNPSLQDCIIDFQGDLFLLQGSVCEPTYCLLKRLGTTLSEKIIRKLFTGGVDALLDIETQKKDLHETNPIEMNPPALRVYQWVEIDKLTQQNMDHCQQFDFKHGPYGVYYREIFFHIPFLIANHLNSQGRFADAQCWYHYIFNPTASEITDPPQDRNWRYLGFRKLGWTTLREILTDQETIEVYKKDPFNPHAIARLRLSAYQKCIVMKYIDNLLDWADSLFAQYTMESVNEATMLYVMASDILGERPAELGECGEGSLKPKNYTTIKPLLEQGEFLQEFPAEMETRALRKTYINASKTKPAQTYILEGTVMASAAGSAGLSPAAGKETLSGGIFKAFDWKKTPMGSGSKQLGVQDSPLIQNPDLIPDFSASLIRTVCYRSGIITNKNEPSLRPVFCIPVNTDLLGYWDRVEDRLYKIRHCLDINGVRRDLALFAPEIDPRLLVRMKAAGLTLEDVIGANSGNLPPYRFAYLIEKAKQYASTVQSFGSALLSALEKKDIEQLNNLRTVHEQNILQLTRQIKQWEIDTETESLQALERQKESITYRHEYYQGLIDQGLMQWERTQQISQHSASTIRILEANTNLMSAIAFLIPQLGSPFAMKYGGQEIGNSGQAFAVASGAMADIASAIAASAGLEATFERREQEWKHNVELADRELKQIDRQLAAASIRQQIANRSLDIHDKNIEQAKEIYDFYSHKFSNYGLYTWLSTTLQMIYRDAYNSAFAMARLAEQAYHFERSDDSTILLDSKYWSASQAGLLAGERLLIALQNMERKFIETNFRTFEIDQSFSLAQIKPEALIQLRENGSCDFNIPECFFDICYPGQYRRMIKAVRLTIPCVTGPYTNVGATLRLTSSKTRTEANTNGNSLKEVPLQRSVCTATSKAQNDAGVFELNFHDERYMPFEGAGAVESNWKLGLPSKLRSFDYSTISDIILHISYTAKDGGDDFKTEVENKIISDLTNNGLYRLLSLKHEFPNAFYQLLHPTGAAQSTEFELGKQHFPYFVVDKGLTLSTLKVYLSPKASKSVTTTGLTLEINEGLSNEWIDSGKSLKESPVNFTGNPIRKWTIAAKTGSLNRDELEDIFILFGYKVSSP